MKKAMTLLIGLILGIALNASAAITILNSSFEEPDTPFYTSGSVSGWDGPTPFIDLGGVWEIGPSGGSTSMPTWPTGAPDGTQIAWLWTGTATDTTSPYFGTTVLYTSISQTLGSTVVPGLTYVLSGYAGQAALAGTGASYEVSILADGISVASVTSTGPVGGFESFTVSWTPDDSYLGQSLGIQLAGLGDGYSGFDDLSMAAVPEPTTILVGALLLLPLGASKVRMLRRNIAQA